jgi:hypothetical protein
VQENAGGSAGHEQEYQAHKLGSTDLDATCFTGATSSIELAVDTFNLSEEGMILRVPRELIPGGQLTIVFHMPNSETRRKLNDLKKMNIKPKTKNFGKDRIELAAEIVWCQASQEKEGWFDTWIKFMFMDDHQRASIREFLENHEKGLL